VWLISFVLCCYGLTQILVYGSIFNAIRPPKKYFGGFFHCPMCIGFHVGWVILMLFKYSSFLYLDPEITDYFIMSCLSSGTSYALCMLFTDDGFNLKLNGDS